MHASRAMRSTKLTRVKLATKAGASVDASLVTREHPAVAISLGDTVHPCDAVIDGAAWACVRDFSAFDEAVSRARTDAIVVHGAERELARTACEVLTRYQRHVERRNAASSLPVMNAVLRAHAELHDVMKPLVAADFDHALDTWQWMLRLEPHAPLAAQCAALFHDVERLESEAERRVEHLAPDYQAFKDTHAKRGAARAEIVLRDAGVDAPTASRAAEIIASHERRGHDPDVDLLNDADGLSFFSLNSPGYADYYGPEQTRRKIAYTLARIGEKARKRLELVRLRADVAAWLAEIAA